MNSYEFKNRKMGEVLLLGSSSSGKTYFLRRFIDKQQDPNPLGTVGIDFKHLSLELSNRRININFWDSSGQERYQCTMSHIISRAASFIIFLDLSCSHSIDYIHSILNTINDGTPAVLLVMFLRKQLSCFMSFRLFTLPKSFPDEQNKHILILGNKLDLVNTDNQGILSAVRETCQSIPGLHFEAVSCKYHFEKAKDLVQDFLRKSYQDDFCSNKVPKTLDFLRELELEHCDNIWFTKQDERKKVNRIVRSKLAKKTNQEEIMIISLIFEMLQLFHTIYAQQRNQLHNIQLQLQHQSNRFHQQITDINYKWEEQVRRIRQQLIQYEYYIVKADELHDSLSQPIASSPFNSRFAEFKRVAERANKGIEEDYILLQDLGKEKIQKSIIIAGAELSNEGISKSRHSQRLIFEEKIQKLQQVIEQLLPKWKSGVKNYNLNNGLSTFLRLNLPRFIAHNNKQINQSVLYISLTTIYKNFGNSGLKISAISLGTAIYNNLDQLDTNQKTIESALKHGINYFDTAQIYGAGIAEIQLGTILKNLKVPREEVVIGTKVLSAVQPDRNSTMSTNRKHVKESLQKSLDRLQLDYVDIVYAHVYDYDTPLEEICRAFHEVIQCGMSFYWATSNWDAETVFNALSICERFNLHKPIGAQNNYNMLTREVIEIEYQSLFKNYRYGNIAWSPLAGGILTGKYLQELEEGVITRFTDKSPNYPLERVRKMFYDPYATEHNFQALKGLLPIARELNCKLTHLALAWIIKFPYSSSALIGARNPEQLQDCLEALKVVEKLTESFEARVNKILGNSPTPRTNFVVWKPHDPIRPIE